MSQHQVKDLEDFLVEAELQHYYDNFKDDLKVKSVPQLKYVEEEDLVGMGMTKPEIRRFKKFFRKECPQGTFSKLKKILTVNITRETNGHQSPPQSTSERSPQPRPANKTIIPEESITLLKTLGTGEFGTVQQGVWLTDNDQKTQVAVKCLSRDKLQTGMPDFLKEATIMQTIDHDNIVRLYGVVLGQAALMLVTELAPMRSLLECLKDPLMHSTFPVHQLCEFAIQVCDGMSYLENKRFIHRDLAARNILVFSKDKVKLSDFGLSRALGVGKDYYQTNFNINLKLPIAWCAPECINYLRFTSASDVWAFGVTLWEMFTYGQQPWANLTGQQILDAIDEPSYQRLEQPEYCPRDFYDVMLKCWEHDPESRPKFTELLLMLPQIKPERVQAKRDGPLVTDDKDFLPFQQLDIITVLDKRPEQAPEEDMWKGALDSGKTGYFNHEDTATYLEIKSLASPGILRSKPKIVRRESSRKSNRSSKRLDVTMISGPQDDLRHTGHIGYDGAMFGDVSFIGNNYNKLPVKVGPNGMTSSVMSLPKPETDSELRGFNHSQSDACILNSVSAVSTSTSQELASSNECVTDSSPITNTSTEEKYEDLDEFDSFKIPELSVGSTFDLGLGGSLMDEVMKALTVSESRETTPVGTDNLTNEKSPLLEKDDPFYSSKNTFDNVAMATDQDGEVSKKGSVLSRSQELAQSPPKEPVLPEPQEKKKKPKLRIQIPGLGSRQKGMRTLSESEERQMDEAIELANSYAMKRASDNMISTPSPKSLDSQSDRSHGDSDGNSSISSPKMRSVFNLRKKSPKQECKTTYTDEIASISDASEEVSAEAQEAYNLLIVKGSIKESRSSNSSRPSLEKRGQKDHDSSTETIEKPALLPRANRNIRAPHIPGIPGRSQEQETSSDSNPLRRLREGVAIIPPKTRPKPGTASTEQLSPTKPNLSANRPFFDKLKEQELSQDSGEGSEEGINPVPLPPRTRPKSSAPPTKPRQRKYPLDLSQYRGPPPPIINTQAPSPPNAYTVQQSATNPRSSLERDIMVSSDLNSSHESSDSVFSSSSQHSSLERRSLQGNKPMDSPLDSPFSVKSVTLTARDLGYQDTADLFWTQPVSLEDLGSNHAAVIPGRESEQDICDEVRLMRKVLSKDVTIEDCMYCLEDTQWEVNSAIKLVKLKQLLSTNLADKERCKEVLMKYGWDVQEAANYLLQHPPGQESPELVHV